MKSTKERREERETRVGADFCSTFCFVLRDSRTLERGGEGDEEEEAEGRRRRKKKRFMRLFFFFFFLVLDLRPFCHERKVERAKEANQGPGTCFQE